MNNQWKTVGDIRKWLEKFPDDKPFYWIQRELEGWHISPSIRQDGKGDILFDLWVIQRENKTVCLNHPDYIYPW